jgi:hypothetical protein
MSFKAFIKGTFLPWELQSSGSQISGNAESGIFAAVCKRAYLQGTPNKQRSRYTKKEKKIKRGEKPVLLKIRYVNRNGIAVIHPESTALLGRLSQISGIAESEVYAVLQYLAQLQSTNHNDGGYNVGTL